MGLFGIGTPKETASLVADCYTRSDVPSEIDGIFQSLVQIAREKGANAVTNVRITTGSYQRQGSQWQVTYIVAYGEAVILK